MKKTFYANDLAPRDRILRVYCVAPEKEHSKADAYIIELDGRLWLLDGGMPNSTTTLDYLHAIRDRWLAGAGKTAGGDCRLKLDWIVSHFHIDHVSAPIFTMLPDPSIEFCNLYLPPDSALAPEHSINGIDGDTKYRPQLADALFRYATGRERIINIDFGAQNILRFSGGSGRLEFTIYPPPYDWGVGERLEYMIENYFGGNRYYKSLATAVVNSCGTWLHLRYGNKTFLFTGDLIKRKEHLENEAIDEMIRAYGGEIGRVDVVKYPHHGQNRNAAAGIVMSLEPEHIIVSSKNETATALLDRDYSDFPESPENPKSPKRLVKTHNCALRDIVFCTDGEILSVTEGEIRERD